MKITYYVASSLDGFIARSDGSIDWLDQANSIDEDYGYKDFYQSVDGIIMGGATYRQVLTLGDWPYAGKQTFILSKTTGQKEPSGAGFFSSIDSLLADIKLQRLQNIWLVGGGVTATALLQHNLITEMIVTYIPIILGKGIRLFSLPAAEKEMTISSSNTYDNGITQIHFGIRES